VGCKLIYQLPSRVIS